MSDAQTVVINVTPYDDMPLPPDDDLPVPTSIGEEAILFDGIQYYPNPSRERLNIVLENEYTGNVLIQVLNLNGQRLVQKGFQKIGTKS